MSEPPGAGCSSEPAAEAETTLDLLARAREGDQAAIEHLITRHLQPLQRFARGRLPPWARDLSDTDDLVQDALLKTLKRLDTFESRHPGALQAYLRQAVMNRLRDEVRRQVRVLGRAEPDGGLDSVPSRLAGAVGLETMVRYEHALMRLTPEQREAIVGRVELGLSYGELALALDKPTSEAARKAAQRALVRLAEEMEGER